jgi:hypothetical protein
MRADRSIYLLAVWLAGCASGTGAPLVTRDELAAPVAPEPSMSVAARPVAPKQAGDSIQASDTVEVKRSAPNGYRAATHDGTLVYCKSTTTLGSRLKKEVCMTPEQYKELEQTGERNRQELRKSIGICSGGAAGFTNCSGNGG